MPEIRSRFKNTWGPLYLSLLPPSESLFSRIFHPCSSLHSQTFRPILIIAFQKLPNIVRCNVLSDSSLSVLKWLLFICLAKRWTLIKEKCFQLFGVSVCGLGMFQWSVCYSVCETVRRWRMSLAVSYCIQFCCIFELLCADCDASFTNISLKTDMHTLPRRLYYSEMIGWICTCDFNLRV